LVTAHVYFGELDYWLGPIPTIWLIMRQCGIATLKSLNPRVKLSTIQILLATELSDAQASRLPVGNRLTPSPLLRSIAVACNRHAFLLFNSLSQLPRLAWL
jgi:hypothetical protein